MCANKQEAEIVIMRNQGIHKIIKSRYTETGSYITEGEMVGLLNMKDIKVAICNENGRVFEKNFKGMFGI